MKFRRGCLVGADRSLHDVRFCSFSFSSPIYALTPGRIPSGGCLWRNGRNIVTHHAEDRSGMGSAIIASAYRLSFLPSVPLPVSPFYLYLFSSSFSR
ncbi:hypothetical protein B0H14DRAFT_2810448, partial [Mycena olivaceomarginata]